MKGKFALITGLFQGTGAAEAKLFAREGAKVVIADVLTRWQAVAAEITSWGGTRLIVTWMCRQDDAARPSRPPWRLRQAGVSGQQRRNLAGRPRAEKTTRRAWVRSWIHAKSVFLGPKLASPRRGRRRRFEYKHFLHRGLVGSLTAAHTARPKVRCVSSPKSTAFIWSETYAPNSSSGTHRHCHGDRFWPRTRPGRRSSSHGIKCASVCPRTSPTGPCSWPPTNLVMTVRAGHDGGQRLRTGLVRNRRPTLRVESGPFVAFIEMAVFSLKDKNRPG